MASVVDELRERLRRTVSAARAAMGEPPETMRAALEVVGKETRELLQQLAVARETNAPLSPEERRALVGLIFEIKQAFGALPAEASRALAQALGRSIN